MRAAAFASVFGLSAAAGSDELPMPLGVAVLGKYPGYTGDLAVKGAVGLGSLGQELFLAWGMLGLESDACATAPAGVANACGIHVHVGTTCEDASAVGGHFYDEAKFETDAWAEKVYKAASGKSRGLLHASVGKSLLDVEGRALVVHDSTGARVACGIVNVKQSELSLSSRIEFGPYPGYQGEVRITGQAGVWADPDSEAIGIRYALDGVEAECKEVPEGVANACGIHIHAGTTCDDADAIGGHYFNGDQFDADPWSPITYEASGTGMAAVAIGQSFDDVQGRALVVHDSTGARVACGLIPKSAVMV